MPQQQREPIEPRKGREGGRWINERPTPEEFGAWFNTNMKIDPALQAADYVGGVVLIPAVDSKAKYVTGYHTQTGRPIIEEGDELSYIPYAKVETRINYFWDLMDVHNDWVAVVEPVNLSRMSIDLAPAVQVVQEDGKATTTTRPSRPDAITALVYQLPDGFSIMSIPVGEGYSHFVCMTQRVSIYRADENGEPKGRPIRTGRGTKQVPLLKGGYGNRQPYADDSSLMKAETGAMGRALGFAGIFVIPGSGVATAEDVQEALAQGAAPVQQAATPDNAGPTAPDVAPVRTGAEASEDDEAAQKARAIELWRVLQLEHPETARAFPAWAQKRGLKSSITEARGAVLRGVVAKLEKLTDEAERAGQQQALPTEGDDDVDAAETRPEISGEAGGSAAGG